MASMSRGTTTRWLAALLLAAAAAACRDGDDDADSGDDEQPGGGAGCEIGSYDLVNDGVLTVGSESPHLPPWFLDDEPTNGQGFESAVAYAVADELGFDRGEVTWATVGVNDATAPGTKEFDFGINQVSITDDRKQAVDFSDPYFTTNGESVEFGLVFEKGNRLVACVNEALASLKDSGQLDELEQEWLPASIRN